MNWYCDVIECTVEDYGEAVPPVGAFLGPFPSMFSAREAGISHWQWKKKDVEDKIKKLRAIDLRCQPRGKAK